MEFGVGNVLLVTREGQLFDRARIAWVEETGDGRILHVVSTMRTTNSEYWIGEVRDETWEVLSLNSLSDAKQCFNPKLPTLTLEII